MFRGIAIAALLTLGTLAGAVDARADKADCARLEATLASLGKGGSQSPLFEKYDAAVHRQQYELDRALRSARRYGCDGGGFVFRSGAHPACGTILGQIDDMRDNLGKLERKRTKLSTSGGSRAERAKVERALARAGCGGKAKTKTAESNKPAKAKPVGGTFRTLCVRTCDGYYWPVSFSTTPDRFDNDEQSCSARCPSAETRLYVHRNPGGDVENMVSREGTPYAELATAYRYREKIDASCGCGTPTGGLLEALNGSSEDAIESAAENVEAGSAEADTGDEPTDVAARTDDAVETDTALKTDAPEFIGEGEIRPSMQIPGMGGEARIDENPVKPDDIAADAEGDAAVAEALAGKDAPDSGNPDEASGKAEAADKKDGDPAERKVRIVGPSYSYIR
ncbi:MAG: DUF2865 domain-containing protein [Hyphomicrobiales bacterium]